MTYDSAIQLLDGRTGRYHLWHPPVMAWLLGLADDLVRGTGLYVVVQTGLFFASLAAIVALRPRVGWGAAAMAALLAISPLVLLYQGLVWKDVLFADAMVAGFVALSAAVRLSGRRRAITLAAAFALLTLAALVRQNGPVILPFAAAAWVVAAVRAGGRPALKGALVASLSALVLCAGLWLAVQASFNRYPADADTPASLSRSILVYDLIGGAKRDPSVDLSRFNPDVASALRADERIYSPERIDTVMGKAGFDDAASDAKAVTGAWRDLVLHRPLAYLGHRLEVFWWILATPTIERCVPVVLGVSGPDETMRALAMPPRFDKRDSTLAAYAARFFHTPAYSHLTYAAVALVLGLALLVSRDPANAPLGMMLLAGLAFAATFALIGLACDYRYLYALDLAAMAAALNWAAGLGVSRTPRNPD